MFGFKTGATNTKRDSRQCREFADYANVYAQNVFHDLGIPKTLASLHSLSASPQFDDAEIRGLVIGTYRTAGILAGIAAKYMRDHERPPEECSKVFFEILNNSPYRQIASDFCDSVIDAFDGSKGDPAYILENEKHDFLQIGAKIETLYSEGFMPEAFECWRDYMKAPVNHIS